MASRHADAPTRGGTSTAHRISRLRARLSIIEQLFTQIEARLSAFAVAELEEATLGDGRQAEADCKGINALLKTCEHLREFETAARMALSDLDENFDDERAAAAQRDRERLARRLADLAAGLRHAASAPSDPVGEPD
ncbi:MAG: hypothetical protein AAGF32_06620 [Pseudomonadota bacterium]